MPVQIAYGAKIVVDAAITLVRRFVEMFYAVRKEVPSCLGCVVALKAAIKIALVSSRLDVYSF